MRFRSFISSALVLAALASPRAFAGDDLDPLGALDASLPRVAEKAERSVVALEVERDDKPERALTQREKMGLGISAQMRYDQRYFTRPPGAVSAVLIASSDKGSTLVTSGWNVRDGKAFKIALP